MKPEELAERLDLRAGELDAIVVLPRLIAPDAVSPITAAKRALTEAASLLRSQTEEIARLREASADLQRTVWSVLKDRRDTTAHEAVKAENNLRDAIAKGWNSHLPTLEEVIAAGPYEIVRLWDDDEDAAINRSGEP